MAGALTQSARRFDSGRLRRRRDRHVRLATDRALTEVAFKLRARERQDRSLAGVPRIAPAVDESRERRMSTHALLHCA
jgi:hypothetical protein